MATLVQEAPPVTIFNGLTGDIVLDDPPTPGNTLVLAYWSRATAATLPTEFTDIASLNYSDSSLGHVIGGIAYRVVQTGDGDTWATAVGPSRHYSMSEWSGLAAPNGPGAVEDLLDEGAYSTAADAIQAAPAGDGTIFALFMSGSNQPDREIHVSGSTTLIDEAPAEVTGNATYGSFGYTATSPATATAENNVFQKMGVVAVAFSGTVTPPAPGSNLVIYDPDGTAIVDLTDLVDHAERFEMDGTGSGWFIISKHNPQATEANLARGNTVRVTYTEIDPEPIFEYLIEEGDFELISSDEEGGEELTFGGPGTLGLLKRAVNEYREWDPDLTPPPTGNIKPALGIWKWNNTAAGGIFARMIREAHARGVLGMVTRTFSTTNDSNGVAWPVTGSWQIPIGSTVYDEMAKLIASGWFHVEMRPGYFLDAMQSYGEDRTGTVFGTGVVRFVKGVNIADQLRRRAYGGEWASHVIAVGDGNYHTSNLGSYPYWAEKAIQVPSSVEDDLDAAADAALVTADDAQEAITFKHRLPTSGGVPDEDAGLYYPGPPGSENGKYWLGDLVTVHSGSGDFEYDNVTHRVFAITLTIDETGVLAEPIVELNAPAPDDFKQEGGLSQQQGGSFGVSAGASGANSPHVHSQYQNLSEKGEADGYASLDDNGFLALDELGAGWRRPVRVATTTNVTIFTALNSGDTIDGVTLAAGDRVLVKDQSTGSQNGIYVAGASPARAEDYDSSAEILGSIVYVIAGTANGGKAFKNTNTSAVTVDTTALTYDEFGAGGGTITVEEDGGTPTVTDVDHIVFAASGDATVDVVDDTGGQVTVTVGATAGGGGSDPIFDTFGTPDTAFEFDTSSQTGLTTGGTPDVASFDGTVADHLLLADDDSTQSHVYAAVSAPCTMIVKLTDFVAYENYQYVGVMLGVASPGVIDTISLLGGASPSLVGRNWNPFSSGSPGSFAITRVPTDSVGFTPWYFGVQVNSTTDVSYYISRSGVVWQPLILNRNPSFTVGSAGVAVGNYAGGSQPRAAGCYDYIRIWNSALTFPAFS